MLGIALALGALLAIAAVVFVARPFLLRSDVAAEMPSEPGHAEQRRIALEEERDRALAALKELEFDHRTGKVSDEDYRALVGELRRSVAETLRALESEAGPGPVAAGRGHADAPVSRCGPESRPPAGRRT